MRNLKNGFTLVEALTALIIFGVVAALTIPQLSYTVQKNKIGVVLGKVVEQIELGCQNFIQQYNEEHSGASLAFSLTAANFKFDEFMRHVGLTSVKTQPEAGGTAPVELAGSEKYKFEGLPAEVDFPNKFKSTAAYDDNLFDSPLTIDINGFETPPNKHGVDQFVFDLRNSGKMIPKGLGTKTCYGDKPTIDENCTARVVAEGYRINY